MSVVLSPRAAKLAADLTDRQLAIVVKLADRQVFTHPEAIRVMNIADFALLERTEIIIPTSFAGVAGYRVRDGFRQA